MSEEHSQLRGVVEMTSVEVAELKALKQTVYAKDGDEAELKKEFEWKAKLLQAGIPAIYWGLGFEHYEGDTKAKAVTKKYVGMIDEAFKEGMGLLFFGKHGTGKTMLSCIIGAEAIKKDYTVKYIGITKVIDGIMAGFSNEQLKERLNTVITRTEFLILDDLGKEYRGIGDKLNPMVRLELDRILRDRVNRGVATIGSTNYGKKEISNAYGDSVFSIFRGNIHFVEVEGPDYREIKGGKFRARLMEGI